MVSSLFTHSNGTTQPLACSLPCQIKRDIAIIIKIKKKKEKRKKKHLLLLDSFGSINYALSLFNY